jgi:NSS family neurotransmitter:Na+ symporter
LLAALTSSNSVMEVIIASAMEEFKLKRKTAVIAVFLGIWVLGCLCSLSLGILGDWKVLGRTIFDLFDYLSANVLMLIGGLLVVFFVAWKLGKKAMHDELTNGGTLKIPNWVIDTLYFLLRFIAPTAILIIMIAQYLS